MTRYEERVAERALSEVDRQLGELDAPESVKSEVLKIFQSYMENELPLKEVDALITGCVFVALKKGDVAITADEMADIAPEDISRKRILREQKRLKRRLDIALEPSRPHQHVGPFCKSLNLGERVENRAREILDQYSESGGNFSGKAPTGLASAAVYLASLLCDESRTQSEVAEVANVTEVTVRNRYQELVEGLSHRVNRRNL